MTLQIRLGRRRSATVDDPLHRTTIGWVEGMSERESWEAGRGVWRIDATRALDQDEVQIINQAGVIVAIGTITAIVKHGERREVRGDLLEGDPRVGTQTTIVFPSRNPISYD